MGEPSPHPRSDIKAPSQEHVTRLVGESLNQRGIFILSLSRKSTWEAGCEVVGFDQVRLPGWSTSTFAYASTMEVDFDLVCRAILITISLIVDRAMTRPRFYVSRARTILFDFIPVSR